MNPRTLAEVADAVGGAIAGDPAIAVTAVATDSRSVEAGAVFVALHGERLDGHAFLAEAFERGAVAAIVDEDRPIEGPAVRVADTGEALLALAADERNRFEGTVVAVTGANGKTSTKDLATAVVATNRSTHASPSSFNNEVGLPMTLLGAPPRTEVIVAELGARRIGDVRRLCEVARPHVAVVTNIGVAHIEIFGSWSAIVEAGAEPVEALGTDGVAILNADDPVVAGYASRTAARVVTFGRAAGADVRAESVQLAPDGRASFDLRMDGQRARVTLAVPGEHMVPNALAASAIGRTLGVAAEAAGAALERARVTRWRMETSETAGGVRILNDAYNANPESVAAALKTARWMAGDGRLIAVLGPMAELGALTAEAHERVGELAARLRVDRLITIGPDAKAIAVAGVREGLEPDAAADYDDLDAALADVVAVARPGDVVLIKGSRVAGLEVLATRLAGTIA
jgi:UDP-N-acetylmuramoyl-tripeptide--D-alanyl-D-alanine ligase